MFQQQTPRTNRARDNSLTEVKHLLKVLFDKRKNSRQRQKYQQLLNLNFQDKLEQLQNNAKAEIAKRLTQRGSPSPRRLISIGQSEDQTYIQQLRAQNKKLRQRLEIFQINMVSQIQQGVRQQTQEMRAILSQYLTFIDKILADKKELLAENEELKAKLHYNFESFGSREVENRLQIQLTRSKSLQRSQGCLNCDQIKQFYQTIMEKVQDQHKEQTSFMLKEQDRLERENSLLLQQVMLIKK